MPRHPDDVKGKPPINLKHGIIVPALRPGEETRQIAWNPSQKVTFLDKAPKEFAGVMAAKPLPVTAPAPEIHAHILEESARNNGTNSANHADSHIVYNYKTQAFMMHVSTFAGTKGKDIPVGTIASNGRVATFASSGSGERAESVSHSGPASSYSSGASSARNSGGNSGSHSYNSGSSGANSGSHSYSSSSSAASGGSYSHSSGGGGGVSSSSSAGSSGSASSGASHASRPR